VHRWDQRQLAAHHRRDGSVYPFASNRLSSSEFAGATFSPDGHTLFANIYGPGMTLAIFGPWQSALG
jgi:secreted PhoX family phosphatase